MRHTIQGYQKSLFIMNNGAFRGYVYIPSYRRDDIHTVVTDQLIHSLTLYYTVTVATLFNISTVVMLVFWLCQFNTGSLTWELCL